MALSRFQLWHGRDSAPAATRELKAGPVTALLEGGDLRHVRVGDIEIVQRIYVAMRDSAWNTIPATLSHFQYEVADDHFRVTFEARHAYHDIDFDWRGAITGSRDGTISFAMDGMARSTFRYNKIGFNVHHPLRECAGRPFHASSPEDQTDGVLPVSIEPQRFVDGRLTALFPPYNQLNISLRDGLAVRFDFDGDLFEMQDHRNWTDGNYKSYGTPMAVPYPIDAPAGARIRQAVTVSVGGVLPRSMRRGGALRVTVGDALGHGLPPIGVAIAGHGGRLSDGATALLRRLRLDHVRVDVHLHDPSYPATIARAAAEGEALGAPLELALFITENAGEQLDRCASLLQSLPRRPARLLIFQDAEGLDTVAGSTPAHLIRLARERLEQAVPGAPFAGGTNQFFAELNRDRPDVAVTDGVAYSINPQVHASDNTSLVENLEAQADTVRMARSLCGDRPIFVSPVTFIGRFGPWAAGPPEPGGLPPRVDVRQASLFGAGWTAGSIKYLAESGAASLTYYETTGWLGLMQRDEGAPMPERFPAAPGAVFPLYHVFADLAEWRPGDLVDVRSEDPRGVVGMAMRTAGALHLLVANLRHSPQDIVIGPLAATRARMRRLDEETAETAMRAPDLFRALGDVMEIHDHTLTLTMAAFAVARVDVPEP